MQCDNLMEQLVIWEKLVTLKVIDKQRKQPCKMKHKFEENRPSISVLKLFDKAILTLEGSFKID